MRPVFLLLLGGAGIGFLIMLLLDRADTISYLVDRDRITLVRGRREEAIGLALLKDANPLERSSAGAYVMRRMQEMREQGMPAARMKEVRRAFTRHCTVDLGSRMFTWGTVARWMEGTPPGRDLVLLRIRDGREMLLSPIHHQDMVDAIAKLMAQPPAPAEQCRERA